MRHIDSRDLYWTAVRVATRLMNSNHKIVTLVSSGVGDGLGMWASGVRAQFSLSRITIPHSNLATIISASVEERL